MGNGMRRYAEGLEFRSEAIEVRSSAGKRIVGVLECAQGMAQGAPVILLVPAFGKMRRDYATLAWYLLQHGFRVLRYDNTCHVGASEGEMFDFTMRSAGDDLTAMLEYVREQLRAPACGVVAPSLGFRVALRALRGRDDVRLLFTVVGVVNLRRTIHEVVGQAVFDDYSAAKLGASYLVLGHDVSTNFLGSALADRLDSLDSTVEDLRLCSFPVVHVAGDDDAWVQLPEVQRAFTEAGKQGVCFLPGVHHELGKNPAAAALAMEQMVMACGRHVAGQALDVVHPTLPEIVRIRRLQSQAA
jgi:alpha-beta hydrolase superfamily lysophospholipase